MLRERLPRENLELKTVSRGKVRNEMRGRYFAAKETATRNFLSRRLYHEVRNQTRGNEMRGRYFAARERPPRENLEPKTVMR